MTRLSLLCSLTGIAALYVGAVQMRPTLTPLAKVNEDYVGLGVMVSGQVIDLHEHRDGHLFLKLKDESGGVISVPIFASVYSELDEPIKLLDNVQVTGQVKLYNGDLEVIPEKGTDLHVVHTPPIGLANVGREHLGELIKTQAVIAQRDIVGNGSLILTLREDGAELPAFVPASIANEDGFPELHVGYTVCASGWLQLYNEHLELKIEDPAHLEVVEAS